MRVFLLNPYFRKAEAPIPSLGLLSLATYLKENGIADVTVCEPGLAGMSEAEALKNASASDIVGITCYTDRRFIAVDFAAKVKQKNKNALIVLGGCHAGFLARSMLERYGQIDCIVDGDGEEALLALAQGSRWETIAGLYFRHDGRVVNPVARDMRRFPTVALDYSFIQEEISDWKDMEAPPQLMDLRHMPIIASRGCPYDCSFCATQALGRWRQAPAEKILSEIRRARDDYGAEYIRFYDPLFAGSDAAVLRFCDLAKKERITDIPFRIDVRADMDMEVLKRLLDVGLAVVGFGVESGSDRVLDSTNKRISRETALQAVENMRALGLWVIGYFMLFFPGETDRERDSTLELVSLFDEYNLQYYKIYPGTGDYTRFLEKGYMTEEFWFDREKDREAVYCNENFSVCPYPISQVIGTTIEHSSPFWKEYILNSQSSV